MKKKNKVLVCVAHSDDETFGCGGTIAKHVSRGDKVYCISFTDGVSARKDTKSEDIKQRIISKTKAAKILGFKWLTNKSIFEDNRLNYNNLLDIVRVIETAKKKIKPNIIYTHFVEDLNIDHRIIAEATLTAFRPIKNNFEKIFSFEVPSATDYRYYKKKQFNPNFISDITKFWKIKKRAILAYKKELQKFPNSRSLHGIETLSKYRGSQNGLKYAEGFVLVKEISR
tara:strand:+ start:173 stop:853 length:681 start_codon:yes stop_codon:yes gene_type:complete